MSDDETVEIPVWLAWQACEWLKKIKQSSVKRKRYEDADKVRDVYLAIYSAVDAKLTSLNPKGGDE